MAQKLADDRMWETGETPFSACKWDEWMKGGTWLARQGDDFFCDVEVFMAELDHRADMAGMDAEAIGEEGTVYFRFHDPADMGKAKGRGKALDFSKAAA
ncbi:hypothetical protein [Streptomyces deccanensis]|uniref:hypothetical protein n=1 Tax=Streptomyces deccanensis TaxID=424188 RepID=UPI001EFB13B6|nr:hypothetical protein [Streptomyces deccanensis]ULR51019.1 hypothetical protein L3078_17895 [Streptomyces deccanensis]